MPDSAAQEQAAQQKWRDRYDVLGTSKADLEDAVDARSEGLPASAADQAKTKSTLLLLCAQRLEKKAKNARTAHALSAPVVGQLQWLSRKAGYKKAQTMAPRFLEVGYRDYQLGITVGVALGTPTAYTTNSDEFADLARWFEEHADAPENAQWIKNLEELTTREAVLSREDAVAKLWVGHVGNVVNAVGGVGDFTPVSVDDCVSPSAKRHVEKANALLKELHHICKNDTGLSATEAEVQKNILVTKARAQLKLAFKQMQEIANAKSTRLFHKGLFYSPEEVNKAQRFLDTPTHQKLFDAFGFDSKHFNVVKETKDGKTLYSTTIGYPGRPIMVSDPANPGRQMVLPKFTAKALRKALARFSTAGHKYKFKFNKADGSFELRFLTGWEGSPYVSAYHLDYGQESRYFLELLVDVIGEEKLEEEAVAELDGEAAPDSELGATDDHDDSAEVDDEAAPDKNDGQNDSAELTGAAAKAKAAADAAAALVGGASASTSAPSSSGGDAGIDAVEMARAALVSIESGQLAVSEDIELIVRAVADESLEATPELTGAVIAAIKGNLSEDAARFLMDQASELREAASDGAESGSVRGLGFGIGVGA